MCHDQKKIRKSFKAKHLQKRTSIQHELATISSCQLGRTGAKGRPDQIAASSGLIETIAQRETVSPARNFLLSAGTPISFLRRFSAKGILDVPTKRKPLFLGSGDATVDWQWRCAESLHVLPSVATTTSTTWHPLVTRFCSGKSVDEPAGGTGRLGVGARTAGGQ